MVGRVVPAPREREDASDRVVRGILVVVRVERQARAASDTARAAARAWSRSAFRSSMFSMPTERRTRPGVTPGGELLLGVSCACVVDAGWDDERAHVADVGEVV